MKEAGVLFLKKKKKSFLFPDDNSKDPPKLLNPKKCNLRKNMEAIK